MMLTAVFALTLSVSSFAQEKSRGREGRGPREGQEAGWMEKMKANRVAFLTRELDLSAEEAQLFWPVYNQAQEEKDAAYKKTREAYKAMMDAVEAGKSDQEVAALLEAYLKAAKVPSELDAEYATDYLKVLPAAKVAKLYVSEERFRKMQFQHMQGGRDGQRGQGAREGQRGPGGREGFQGGRDGQRQGGRDAQRQGASN